MTVAEFLLSIFSKMSGLAGMAPSMQRPGMPPILKRMHAVGFVVDAGCWLKTLVWLSTGLLYTGSLHSVNCRGGHIDAVFFVCVC